MSSNRNQLVDLQNYTFVSRYAQYLPDKNRRETYEEAVSRTKGQHETFFADRIAQNPKIQAVIDEAYESYYNQEILGSQRSLQFGGPAVLSKHPRLYNCSSTYVNRPRVFAEILYLLLCGTGVGCSVQKHHVAWLPKLRTTPKTKTQTFVIPDTIEGWADALDFMVNCYLETDRDLDGVYPVFDYSLIRPKGSKFSHGVGRAPGPDGLRQSLERIQAVLDAALAANRSHLRPIDAYDIIAHASDAVLSGGVRRSALLIMFSVDDEEMMNAKTGDWYITNPQRARSNNSAVLLRGKTSKEAFHKLMQRTKEFGEPGFIWVNSLEDLFNPCFAGDTPVLTKKGVFPIKSLVGKTVEVHDGDQWVKINSFKQTASNQKLLQITLTSGDKIKCTYNHRLINAKGQIVEAWNLKEGDALYANTNIGLSKPDGWSRIVSIEELETPEDVYCCEVPTNNEFTLGCGVLTRQCVEISMYGYDTTDPNWKETPEYSGVQMCNLTTINGAKCTSRAVFHKLARRAAILGTMQAAYTKFDYLGKRTENIVAREALLGVSITGIMQNAEVLLSPECLEEGAKIVVATNKEVAAMLGINPSPRNCCVKPEGSSASMIGTASGVHPWHAPEFIRCVQVNKNEVPGQFYALNNGHAVVESVWSATNSDNCIRFACTAPEGSLFKRDISAARLLAAVRTVQKHWVMAGTDPSISVRPDLNHNVSNTINVKDNEWDEVEDIIFNHQDYYTGVSLLGATGDKDYDQAPFAEVKSKHEICKEYRLSDEGYSDFEMILDKICKCFVDPWKFNNHVKGYTNFTSEDPEHMMLLGLFQNDPKGVIILKEIWLRHEFDKLRNEYSSVDYRLMYEEDNNTTATQDSACAGGACVY